MTGDAQGLQVLHVIGVGDELQLHDVVDLERLSRMAVDAGVTVPPLHRFPRSLPRHPVPDPPSRVGGVALSLTLPPTVGTATLLQVTSLEALLATGAQPQHRIPLSLSQRPRDRLPAQRTGGDAWAGRYLAAAARAGDRRVLHSHAFDPPPKAR
jgi:hypothetical protein